MKRYTVVPALLIFAIVGCDTTVQPSIPDPPEKLEVFSILKAGDSTQYALVSEPRPADEERMQYVQAASVSIAGERLPVIPEESLDPYGGGRFPLARPGKEDANYVTDSLFVKPGKRLRLRVVQGKREVTGTVRVPESFTGTADSMTVYWQPSAGAEQYTLRVRRYDDVGDVEWEYVTTTPDTVATVPAETDYGAFRPGPHGVIVTAADSNLVQYTDPNVRRSGIEGGFGVFGAITRIQGTVVLPATDDNERREAEPLLRPQKELASMN